METNGTLLFLYTETPLHAGTGTTLGSVDLPLQRERMSKLPVVQSSGVKGSLREVFRNKEKSEDARNAAAAERQAPQGLTVALFGPEPPSGRTKGTEETEEAVTHAGALSIGDARLLLLPVRTVFGGWAWATCPLILSRLVRDWECLGRAVPTWHGKVEDKLHASPKSDDSRNDKNRALGLVSKLSRISPSNRLIIEDTEYPVLPDEVVGDLASWLVQHTLPQTEAYKPFCSRLAEQLVVLTDEEFAFLSEHCTEVVTRIRIDPQTGTVAKGALWTEENLPAESLLWSLALISKDRRPKDDGGKVVSFSPKVMLDRFTAVMKDGSRRRLGGDRTVGRGMLSVRISEGVPA